MKAGSLFRCVWVFAALSVSPVSGDAGIKAGIDTQAAENTSKELVPFTWDKVPVWAGVGKEYDFTEQELDFLASHYSLIFLEKNQGFSQYKDAATGFIEACRQIKKRNPSVKVLFYWNALISWPFYEVNQNLPDEFFLKDSRGQFILVHNNKHRLFNLASADMRKWWCAAAADVVTRSGADGLFSDAYISVSHPYVKSIMDAKTFRAINEGASALVKETAAALGPDKINLINGLRCGDGGQFAPLASGVLIEEFGYHDWKDATKEQLAADIQTISDTAKSGKIVCVKAWTGFLHWTDKDKDMAKKPHAELLQLARERITFQLACFLAGAERNCYFFYSWGWAENEGVFDWYPELDKPLGPPLGPAVRTGWVFKREFAHASVSVNLENKTAQIDWK